MKFYPIWPKNGNNTRSVPHLNVDYTNSNLGYIRVWSDISNKKLKVQIEKNAKIYNYDLNQKGEPEIFPLQMGSGRYKVTLCQHKIGKIYTKLGEIRIDVTLTNDFCTFLCPSQYVNYKPTSKCVLKAAEICDGAQTEREKVSRIKSFMSKGFVYDYVRAISQTAPYLCDADACINSRIGLCLDFAVLFAAMARSQGVPTKVVIGYLGSTYHAWNSVYVDNKWLRLDMTPIIQRIPVKNKTYKIERVY